MQESAGIIGMLPESIPEFELTGGEGKGDGGKG